MRTLATTEAMSAEHDELSLELRHRAALRLIHSGAETDGELLLSLVIWPTSWLDLATSAALGADAA